MNGSVGLVKPPSLDGCRLYASAVSKFEIMLLSLVSRRAREGHRQSGPFSKGLKRWHRTDTNCAERVEIVLSRNDSFASCCRGSACARQRCVIDSQYMGARQISAIEAGSCGGE